MPLASRSALVIPLAVALLATGSCHKLQPKDAAGDAQKAARERAAARRLQAACASPSTYDRLKQVAFDDARRFRISDPMALDTLASYSIVRMENPVVKSRDDELDVTVCSGRFVLDLPPGAEKGFEGQRHLAADIEYSAQTAADGSGLVYHMKGAEPIVYKLAAFGLKPASYPIPTGSAAGPVQPPAPIPGVSAAPSAAVVERAAPAPPTPPSPRAPAATPRPAPREAYRNIPATPRLASPSFDCRRARSRSERLVCASPRLAALDRAMSSQFYSEMSNGDARTRAALRGSRDRFLRWREGCPSEECIAQAYRDRMAEIRDIAGGE